MTIDEIVEKSKLNKKDLLEIIWKIKLEIDRNKGKYIYPTDVYNYIKKIDQLCDKALGLGVDER